MGLWQSFVDWLLGLFFTQEMEARASSWHEKKIARAAAWTDCWGFFTREREKINNSLMLFFTRETEARTHTSYAPLSSPPPP